MEVYSGLAQAWSEYTFSPSAHSNPDPIAVDLGITAARVQLSDMIADMCNESNTELPFMDFQSCDEFPEMPAVESRELMDFLCAPECCEDAQEFWEERFIMDSQAMPDAPSDSAKAPSLQHCSSAVCDFMEEDGNCIGWDMDPLDRGSEEVDLLSEDYNCIFAELNDLVQEKSDRKIGHHSEAVENLSLSTSAFNSDLPETNERANYEKDAVSSPSPPASTSGALELIFPWSIEDQADRIGLRLVHLLKAYAEAIHNRAPDVADIVFRRLRGMVSPVGETNMERLAYYFLHSLARYSDNSDNNWARELTELQEKCGRNELEALRAVYEMLPCARMAHFAANQSILECLQSQRQAGGGGVKIHIIDFDIAEGLQWPPLMEALKSSSTSGSSTVELRITAIKWAEDPHPANSTNNSNSNNNNWRSIAEGTERRLREYANSLRIEFSFQQAELQDLGTRIDVGEGEALVANCMVGLSHMTWQRRKCFVWDYLCAAQELHPSILAFACGGDQIFNVGKGDFGTRFDSALQHFCAAFDSVEAAFPQSPLARTVVECLLLAPKIFHSLNYENNTSQYYDKLLMNDLPRVCGFSGIGLSEANMRQADDMLKMATREREQCTDIGYNVEQQLTGNKTEQLVVSWSGTPLMFASAWR